MSSGQVILPRDSFEIVGKVVEYDGKLARIISVAEGRTVHMRFVEEPECPTCGHQPGISLLTHSPLFQTGVRPAQTLDAWEERNDRL